jgi:ankyrin repeat protein
MDSAITGFMREMIQRTSKKVNASRDAAIFLHSLEVLSNGDDFAGVKKYEAVHLIKILKERRIGAHLGADLDDKVEAVINELQISEDCSNQPVPEKDQIQRALDLTRSGDLANIRILSIEWPTVMRLARDDNTGETCLHLAAKARCIETCKWLISEASVDYRALDKNNRSPLHSAVIGSDPKVIEIFAKLCKHEPICWEPDVSGNTPLDLIKLLTVDKDYIYQLFYAINGPLNRK